VKGRGRGGKGYHGCVGSATGAGHGDDFFALRDQPGIGGHDDGLDADLHPLADGAEDHGHRLRSTHAVEPVGVEQHGAEVNPVPQQFQLGDEFRREALVIGEAVLVRDHDESYVGARQESRRGPGRVARGRSEDYLAYPPSASLSCRQAKGLVGVCTSAFRSRRCSAAPLPPACSELTHDGADSHMALTETL